jgi:predicted metal-dependent phosphoesterase TrpH
MAVADFHVHLKYSRDSCMSPKALVRTAYKKGIDVVAVTDHDTLRGSFETLEVVKNCRSEILVVPGVEVSTTSGHVIGLFIQEDISATNFVEAIEQVKEQDGLVVIPHPFKKSQKFGENEFAMADLIEALNGRATTKENELAMSLGKRVNRPLVAGSDAHFSFELGRILTILAWKPNDLDELRKMLLSGCIVGIKGNSDVLTPRLAHILSFSLEMYRRIVGF